MRNTYVEIDTLAIKNNIINIKNTFKGYKYYIGVVKGNAYGHGFEIAKTMEQSGINYFAVSNLDEAKELRKYVDSGIMLLNPLNIKFLDKCLEYNVDITIGNLDEFKKILNYDNKSKLKIQIKLNTGMNRIGISSNEEIEYIIKECKKEENPTVIGIYTHLATSGFSDKLFDNQVDNFKKITNNINLSDIEMIHMFRSNSIEYHKKLDFCNACRLGLILYGYSQTFPFYGNSIKDKIRKFRLNQKRKKFNISETYDKNQVKLFPAYKLKSEVIDLHYMEANSFLGYGATYKSEKREKIAVIDIGYVDGLDQRNTGRDVLIKGKKYKIVGTVNMCNITVLVDDNVEIGDEVIVIGDEISTKYIAKYTKTTPYVVISMITPFIERRYRG